MKRRQWGIVGSDGLAIHLSADPHRREAWETEDPREFAAEPPRQDYQHNQVAADLRRAERGSGATAG
jgi:hypothetical protein